MKALFIYDHIFYEFQNQNYSGGAFTPKVWDRYLNHFDSVTVIARGVKHTDKDHSLVKSSKQNVFFKLLFEVKGGKDYYLKSKLIKKHIKKNILKHDFIIIRMPSALGKIAADLCKKLNISYSVEVVGCVWDSYWNYGGLLPKLIAPYNFFKTKNIIKASQSAIYVTKYFLQKRYPVTVLNSYASNVEINAVNSEVLSNRLIKYENIKSFKIGIGGSFNVKYKGQKELIDALVLASKDIPDFTVEMIGPGNYNWLEKYSNQVGLDSKIFFLGRLPGTKGVLKWLDSIDIYIHPSKQEGLPRTVIEAMSIGCPVLASSVAGIPELLNKEFLHKPGNSKELSKHIVKYFNNLASLKSMAETNFIKAQDYTSEKLSQRRNVFWKQAINQKLNN